MVGQLLFKERGISEAWRSGRKTLDMWANCVLTLFRLRLQNSPFLRQKSENRDFWASFDVRSRNGRTGRGRSRAARGNGERGGRKGLSALHSQSLYRIMLLWREAKFPLARFWQEESAPTWVRGTWVCEMYQLSLAVWSHCKHRLISTLSNYRCCESNRICDQVFFDFRFITSSTDKCWPVEDIPWLLRLQRPC